MTVTKKAAKKRTKRPPSKKVGKKKATPGEAKKAEAVKSNKSEYHTISGEIVLSVASTTLSENKEFVSTELIVDKAMRSFGRGSVTVDRNGVRTLVLLEARQVELMLKLLRQVPLE
jgi:hypothetical protein